MRTGEVADRAGVNIQTIRYYERRGLLPEPERRHSGYRMYGPGAVRVVRFVRRSQQLGFSLKEMETLLHLAGGGPEGCDAARELADEKIAELENKIATLRAMRDALGVLLSSCERPAVTGSARCFTRSMIQMPDRLSNAKVPEPGAGSGTSAPAVSRGPWPLRCTEHHRIRESGSR